MDDTTVFVLALALGFLGNLFELYLMSRHIAKRTTRDVIAGINLWLGSDGSKEAIDRLLEHVQHSPKTGEMAGILVEEVAEAAKAKLTGTIGGVKKALNRAGEELAEEALAEQAPFLSLAQRALSGGGKRKKGSSVGAVDVLRALQAAQGAPPPSGGHPNNGGSSW